MENVKDPKNWVMPGFNFRFTDVQASMGIVQLKRLPERIEKLKDIYFHYADGLKNTPFQLIPVNLGAGEIPVYSEFLVNNRIEWIRRLEEKGIEVRPFYPDIDKAPYLLKQKQEFPNSRRYGIEGIYLPSGPKQSNSNIKTVIKTIESLNGFKK